MVREVVRGCSNLSVIWSNIIRVERDIRNVEIDFSGSFWKKVGDGHLTLFWKDK